MSYAAVQCHIMSTCTTTSTAYRLKQFEESPESCRFMNPRPAVLCSHAFATPPDAARAGDRAKVARRAEGVARVALWSVDAMLCAVVLLGVAASLHRPIAFHWSWKLDSGS